jgi:prolyl 4-hydroxylase
MYEEYLLDKKSFIGGWFIEEKICDDLINLFEKNIDKTTKGKTVHNDGKHTVDLKYKSSLDISVNMFDKKDQIYFDEYGFALSECLKKYVDKYNYVNQLSKFSILESPNIQKYKPNEGFFAWHFERNGKPTSSRALVFMTYLNNVEDGGTEFLYQDIITEAKKGLTLFFPVDWTHTHKGQISKTKDKYIITGFFNYE